ncbi:MAG: glycosyltransferase [Sulfitobacter sp.]
MKNPRLIALVVTFNRLAPLQKTLSTLLDTDPADLAGVLVINNASTDGTAEWLESQQDARLHLLHLAENTGGAGGFEAGMRHAVDQLDPDWLLLADDDARPAPGTLQAFHAKDRSSHEAWLAAVRFPDGDICEMNRPWINPFWSLSGFWAALRGGRGGFHIPDSDYDAPYPREVDGGSFVGLFVAKHALEKAGYPDGRLFIYGDDVLYTLGLRAGGGRIAFDPALAYVHDCGTEMGSHPIKPLWKVYYMYRNQLLVYRRAAGPVLFWPVAALKAFIWWRKSGRYGADRKIYQALLRRALCDGIKGRRGASFAQVREWAVSETIS